ncbi:shikimate kinase AroL [Desulfovibrio litoralis]|uniref:Shikimate kinase n=1 Tax=Desulfovibrio litoralis DSM 11393 TaxID=1121455 RepID=A0A1M7S7E2_9BACT|nr:shikimate kinase AroL [Desulfovibrio litoralis]SHN54386.1 shikimate kinase [Desulfovibrio litoralis DSM 11393]
MDKTIFLIGLRASGKTSLANFFVENSEYLSIDTDVLCQAKAGMSIAQLVESKGWEAFRTLESEVLEKIICEQNINKDKQPHLIVSTGGGIILSEKNRELLKNNGFVVYLKAEPEVLYQRLILNPGAEQRPNLTNYDLLEELKQTLQCRKEFYENCADLILDASLNHRILFDKLISALQKTKK